VAGVLFWFRVREGESAPPPMVEVAM